jgi:hypothetical protein
MVAWLLLNGQFLRYARSGKVGTWGIDGSLCWE